MSFVCRAPRAASRTPIRGLLALPVEPADHFVNWQFTTDMRNSLPACVPNVSRT